MFLLIHLESGDVDGLNVSSKLLADNIMSQQLLFDSLRVGLRLVALIHRHDHRNCDTAESTETQQMTARKHTSSLRPQL